MGAPIPSLIAIRDSAEHARRRRTWNRGFNTAAVKQYEPAVYESVSQLLEVIVQCSRVDLGEKFGHFALASSLITQLKVRLTFS